MGKEDKETMKNHQGTREFVVGLVEVGSDRLKFRVKGEFLTTSESGFTGLIALDPEDEGASVDKMRAAAEFFAELAQDLRQAAKQYQSPQPETIAPDQAETLPRNPQQQAEHLEMIHGILEQLPAAEKAIYQKFGFGDRAKMYKMIDYETDPVKMQALICTMINSIDAEKGGRT
jgi:hypothetical protein